MSLEQIARFEEATGLEVRLNPDTVEWVAAPPVDDDPRRGKYWKMDGVRP